MVGAGNAEGSVCRRLMEDICFDKVYRHDCKGRTEKLEAGDKGKMRGGGGELAMVI